MLHYEVNQEAAAVNTLQPLFPINRTEFLQKQFTLCASWLWNSAELQVHNIKGGSKNRTVFFWKFVTPVYVYIE